MKTVEARKILIIDDGQTERVLLKANLEHPELDGLQIGAWVAGYLGLPTALTQGLVAGAPTPGHHDCAAKLPTDHDGHK